MKRLDRTGWALLAVAVVLLGILIWCGSCAIKRWERRLERVENAVDATEDTIDTTERVIDKTGEVLK